MFNSVNNLVSPSSIYGNVCMYISNIIVLIKPYLLVWNFIFKNHKNETAVVVTLLCALLPYDEKNHKNETAVVVVHYCPTIINKIKMKVISSTKFIHFFVVR